MAYHGGAYSGFAAQPAQPTIAGALLTAIRGIDPSVDEVRGASRTDAGVHARDQRVAFDALRILPARGWVLGLNRRLPPSIAVVRAAFIEPGFLPRFQSSGKLYRYLLFDSLVRDPFLEGQVWRVDGAARPEALALARAEATSALGTHDFAAFRAGADKRPVTERTIRAFDVRLDPLRPEIVRIDVEGTAFLHNMVRILVGTLVDVGRRRLAPGAIARAFASLDRRDLGMTAPPDGLTLVRVDSSDDGRDPWPAGAPQDPGVGAGDQDAP